MMRLILLAFFCLFFASLSSSVESSQISAASLALSSAVSDLTMTMYKEHPEIATDLELTDQEAGGRYKSRLTDSSYEAIRVRTEKVRQLARKFAAIDQRQLKGQEFLTHAIATAALRNSLSTAEFGYGSRKYFGFTDAPIPYVVSHLTGAFIKVPETLESQAINNMEDGESYLERLAAYAVVIDQETDRVKAESVRGIIPPSRVLELTLNQLNSLAKENPAESRVVTSFKSRLEKVVGMSKNEAAHLVSRSVDILATKVQPALRLQAATLVALQPRSNEIPGIWKLPKGNQFYAAALKAFTSSNMSPEEIHRLGLSLVAKAVKEIDDLLKSQGLTTGTLEERIQKISKDPSQLYPNTEEGKILLLSDLNARMIEIQSRLPEQFSVFPKAKVEIVRIPADREESSSAGYFNPPTPDGSRPGRYYINLRDTKEMPRFSLPSLTYHEASPGHHHQMAISQEAKGIPIFRSSILMFLGYMEGWGLYAEQLADEMGVYKSRPIDRLGYLQAVAFRAARLVVDTGLHYKRWSRSQAIDYLVSVTGNNRGTLATEVDRYMVWPGQACAYMIGRETFTKLRENARAILGNAFDQRAFHDKILLDGPQPLAVLKENIAAWIRERQTGRPQSRKGPVAMKRPRLSNQEVELNSAVIEENRSAQEQPEASNISITVEVQF